MTKWVLTAGLTLLAGSVAAQGGPGAAELQACDAAAKKGQWDTVVASCEKALEVMGEEHVGARYYLGWGYRGKQNYVKGIENFQKFLALAKSGEGVTAEQISHAKSKIAELNVLIGRGHLGDKQYSKAVPYFEKAIASDRNNEDAHRFLALAAMQLKDDAKASKHFAEVIRLAPKDSAAYYYSGMIALRGQDSDKAIDSFKKFVAVIEPSDKRASSAFYYLCTLPYNAGDLVTAKPNCESYMASSPEPGSQTDTVKKTLDAINQSS